MLSAIERVEFLADDLEREVAVALRAQHIEQPVHVLLAEPPVARRLLAVRGDQAFRLEIPQLGYGDVREFGPDHLQYAADGARRAGHQLRPGSLSEIVARYFPIWISSPSRSTVRPSSSVRLT